jgi:hypothetical protein
MTPNYVVSNERDARDLGKIIRRERQYGSVDTIPPIVQDTAGGRDVTFFSKLFPNIWFDIDPGQRIFGHAVIPVQLWGIPQPSDFQGVAANVFAHWEDTPTSVISYGIGGTVYVGSPVQRISGSIGFVLDFTNSTGSTRRVLFAGIVNPPALQHPPLPPPSVNVIIGGMSGMYYSES